MKSKKAAGVLAALVLSASMTAAAWADCPAQREECLFQNENCAYLAAVSAYQQECAAREKAYCDAVKAYQKQAELEQEAYKKAVKQYQKEQARREAACQKALQRCRAGLLYKCKGK